MLVEVAALLLFISGSLETRKRGSARLLEFVMIFFYGLLLEELDMRIFKTYHYGEGFFFTVGQVPLCIAWLWAVILASSMAISDATGIPEALRPFLDGLLAVWIDLAIDAIAIRIGYWSWVIPLNEGWFGVPAGNLYAWMWVAFFYSLWARGVRRLLKRDTRWKWTYLVLPVLAYLGLYLAMTSVGSLGKILGLTSQRERLYLFGAQFLIFLIVVLAAWSRRRAAGESVAPVWRGSRLAIHLYFLLAFFLFGIFQTMPLLGVISLFVIGGELLLHVKLRKLPLLEAF